jgi:hypothetical protein
MLFSLYDLICYWALTCYCYGPVTGGPIFLILFSALFCYFVAFSIFHSCYVPGMTCCFRYIFGTACYYCYLLLLPGMFCLLLLLGPDTVCSGLLLILTCFH